MLFVDRVSGQPNRYALTTEGGDKHYVTLDRADNPITEGTPLNAEVLNGMVEEINDNIEAVRTAHQNHANTANKWMSAKGALYIESTANPGCYYRTVGGETEWINPPMHTDVVYRTTERYDGKPVYVVRKYVSPVPEQGANGILSIPVSGLPGYSPNPADYSPIVSLTGVCVITTIDESGFAPTLAPLPSYNEYGGIGIIAYARDGNVVIHNQNETRRTSIWLTVKFVKTIG